MAVVLARGAGFGWGLPVRLREWGAAAVTVGVTVAWPPGRVAWLGKRP